jgi:HNH endonuclease
LAKRSRKLSEARLRALVEKRAGRRCEYCQAPQAVCGYRYHLEHIIPSSQGGPDAPANRALACAACNLAKADKTLGVDSESGAAIALYDPRRQAWREHFRWAEDRETLIGLTPTGRATVVALDLNDDLRKEARRLRFESGWLPQEP